MIEIKVVIERGKVVPFGELPPYSIALDGYVQGPGIDLENQRISFDHHGDCIRHCTKATCEQVLDAILLGLDPSNFTTYLNDVDADSALSVWLLQNPEKAIKEHVRLLTMVEEQVDALGLAYPPLHPELADFIFFTIMEPATEARKSGKADQIDLYSLLGQCLENFDKWDEGVLARSSVPADPYFEVIRQEHGVVMVKSDQPGVMRALYSQGYDRVVVYQDLPNGRRRYTLSKRSDFITNFPLPKIYAALNILEPGWGGSTTIGGSPRQEPAGSKLTPDQVFQIVGEVLASQT